ncbi:MAG: hypothetical protein AAF682_14545 [Planctomycetota bacterium]
MTALGRLVRAGWRALLRRPRARSGLPSWLPLTWARRLFRPRRARPHTSTGGALGRDGVFRVHRVAEPASAEPSAVPAELLAAADALEDDARRRLDDGELLRPLASIVRGGGAVNARIVRAGRTREEVFVVAAPEPDPARKQARDADR